MTYKQNKVNMQYFLLLFFSVIISNSTFCQNQLSVFFFDSETGLTVTPDNVSLVDLSTDRAVFSLEKNQLELDGQVTVDLQNLSNSGHVIFVEKIGFVPMSTYIENKNVTVNNINFYLSNESKTSINPNLTVNKTLIYGYVTDEKGQAVPNTLITFSDKMITGKSNAKGYFEVQVPVKQDDETVDISFSHNGYNTYQATDMRLWSGGDWKFMVKLQPGTGKITQEGSRNEASLLPLEESYKEGKILYPNHHKKYVNSMKMNCLPTQIRVGTNCSCSSCSGVDVHTVQNYVKRVLPHEWIVSWANWNNGAGAGSLRAGSVSIRSYSSWFAYNPISSSYDICSTTCCQVYQNSTNSTASAAVDVTDGWAVMAGNNVARSEYSAENNDYNPTTSCGNGRTGPNTTGTSCITDPVCSGRSRFGHGRGMCQWGTARWASGWTSSSGSSHGYGTKTWQGIVTHYYPDYSFVNCGCASSLTLNGTLSGSTTITAGTAIYSTNVIPSGSNITMTAGNLVELNPGFDARNGALYEAYIGGCSNKNLNSNLPAPSSTLMIEQPPLKD